LRADAEDDEAEPVLAEMPVTIDSQDADAGFRKQAIVHLDDTISSAMKQEQWVAAGSAAHELVECHGWCDARAAAKNLCV